jgi:cathepsin A (carboxypeptidase C)
MDIHRAFQEDGAFSNPTTKELAYILDAYTDILDYIINTPGTIWEYDRLGWIGQAEYSIKKWQPLPVDVAATGAWKATSDGRLAFVAVDKAGHTVPGDVREGSYNIIQEWLRGGWRM